STVYLYILYPLFLPKQLYYNPSTNQTIYEKPLPLSPYFPFDEHKYHVLAYLVEEIGCTVCIFINYGTDTLFYSFMSYVLGQIDILKYFINNFDSYSKKIKGQLDCDDDRSDFVTMQLCISEHQRIISKKIKEQLECDDDRADFVTMQLCISEHQRIISLNKTSKLYFPEDLCVKKMYNMFCELHMTIKLYYESYRTIFNHDFDIAFGYPITDTCSTCDEFVAKLKGLEAEKRTASNDEDAKK
ncbi:unnamed protein product, partial [Psylliodes chrysocephalus]